MHRQDMTEDVEISLCLSSKARLIYHGEHSRNRYMNSNIKKDAIERPFLYLSVHVKF